MRLVSFLQDGVERLGVERADGRYFVAASISGAPATMPALLAGGVAALDALRAAFAAASADRAASTDSAASADPGASADRAASTDSAASADRAASTDSAASADRAASADPGASADRAASAASADRAASAASGASAASAASADRAASAASAASADRAASAASAASAGRAASAASADPGASADRAVDSSAAVDPSTVRLLAPVPRPGKIVAVGLNYHQHAAEQNRQPPRAPMLFAKFPTAVIANGDTIEWDPDLTGAVDLEAELAVVIGRTARRVTADAALDHVLGYTCLNDVTARDLQESDKQFVRGKSLDTFCPMGPVLVTADEIPDPGTLRIRGLRNGEVMQDASTSDLIFSVPYLIAFCSRAFTLEPGDVIATGTPAGVGWYRQPRVLLGEGDEVAIEIEGIGRLVNTCHEVLG